MRPTPRLTRKGYLLLALIAAVGALIFVTAAAQMRDGRDQRIERETELVAEQVRIRLEEWIRTRRRAVEAFVARRLVVPGDRGAPGGPRVIEGEFRREDDEPPGPASP